MHFAIRYLTEYRYDGPVTDNLNALRVTPATTAIQRVDDFGVRVDPQTRLHHETAPAPEPTVRALPGGRANAGGGAVLHVRAAP